MSCATLINVMCGDIFPVFWACSFWATGETKKIQKKCNVASTIFKVNEQRYDCLIEPHTRHTNTLPNSPNLRTHIHQAYVSNQLSLQQITVKRIQNRNNPQKLHNQTTIEIQHNTFSFGSYNRRQPCQS